jgi:hypothetical protein
LLLSVGVAGLNAALSGTEHDCDLHVVVGAPVFCNNRVVAAAEIESNEGTQSNEGKNG